MNAQVVTYVSDFVLAGCAFLALLIIIPAASASAQQLKPSWRAWVWPLAFVSFALGSLSFGFQAVYQPADTHYWNLLGQLAAGLGLTLIVLNSIYRLLVRRTAPYFAPFIWICYICFSLSVLVLTDNSLALPLFVALCTLILMAVYATIYVLERERASDALPALVAAVLTCAGGIINSFNFKLDWGWLVFTQEFPTHLLQISAIFFFLSAASKGYVVKYALHRRQQRESERILLEVK